MKVFTVGGAVRDKLLGVEPNDIDYVVVGSTPEEMLSLGYEKVGADFPVFLHPETKDEYALARIELKTGSGYLDFNTFFDPTITLEDDLLRRDLTINAMAMDDNNVLFDPYNGSQDIKDKKIRHVSDSFKDDPLRILRVARFCAKMPDFTIANETLVMLQKMIENGEANNLKKERIWKELEKVMTSKKPSRFFEALDEIGALQIIFPEIKKMQGVPQRMDYHAEGDVYVHTLMVIDEATKLSENSSNEDKVLVRMSALLHDIGKAFTSLDLLYNEDGSVKGSHNGHDGIEVVKPLINKMAERLSIPNNVKVFCLDVAFIHQRVHNLKVMSAKGVTRMFNDLAIKQKSETGKEMNYVDNLLMSCYADSIGRKIMVNNVILDAPTDYPQAEIFRKCFNEYSNCSIELKKWIQDYSDRNSKQPEGLVIKDRLNSIRVTKIKGIKPQ